MLQDRRTARLDLVGLAGRARLFAFLGPATLVSVGYMDPGNWATDVEGGARFGDQLLWVLVVSNGVALLLQTLATRLGVVTGLDLAQACRAAYSRRLSFALWVLAELAIVACDLAEVLGSAIALKLLFGLPMVWGACLTVLDVFLVLALQRRGVRTLEAVVLVLILTIAVCLAAEMWLVRPDPARIAAGLLPTLDRDALTIAIGILGATVMPHNLYLHSALVKTRDIARDDGARREALRYYLFDTALALNLALLVNAAILILASAVFFANGVVVTELTDAHRLLAPLLGTAGASLLFAVALLAAGQSSTVTGTLAGQVVMEGFLRLALPPVWRRLATRFLALVPALVVLILFGEEGSLPLLVASQVILSLQLPFAIVPLLRLTSSPAWMGPFASRPAVRRAGAGCAVFIVAANATLVARTVGDWGEDSLLGAAAGGGVALAAAGLLACVMRVRLAAPLDAARGRDR